MADYDTLQARLQNGEVIVLDGAIGTQLQQMNVPMDNAGWAATALATHTFTVRQMHEKYILAGVDVVTANSYSSARHNLEPLGMGDLTRELNLRAVILAREARDRVARKRPVYVAGSVSGFGITTEGEPTQSLHRHSPGRSAITGIQAKDNLREQAEILADAGADLLLVEATGGSVHREWVLEACLFTGLPVWTGFKCRLDASDGVPKIGYESNVEVGAEVGALMQRGGSVVNIFHSDVDAATAAIAQVKQSWSGPIGVYPEARRDDYTATWRDSTMPTKLSVSNFVDRAVQWVGQGVQVIGGCCGIELEYIAPLRDRLPTHIPSAGDSVIEATTRSE